MNTFSRAELKSEAYRIEKIEAYNVAIEALRHHESASEENISLSQRLRENLADKLEREINHWADFQAPNSALNGDGQKS